MKTNEKIKYLGVNDHEVNLFEGQFPLKNGMSYNSYLIEDEKIAILDTVDEKCITEYLKNVKEALNGREPTYLVIHHMEPDHSAGIKALVESYPNISLVVNNKTSLMLKNFFRDLDLSHKIIEVKDGEELSLGKMTLKFIFTPFVHWPEVMMSYLSEEAILFSADAFGSFGVNDIDQTYYPDEARRYYYGIVGKYGLQTKNALMKLSSLKINAIYPLHGHILNDNLDYYISLYKTWASYLPEDNGVCILVSSVYNNTLKVSSLLKSKLESKGIEATLINLNEVDSSFAISEAFKHKFLILASITYNNDIFPSMNKLITSLCERNYQNHIIGFIENGSWACNAKKVMSDKLSSLKNTTYLVNSVKITSSMNDENIMQIDTLVDEIESQKLS